MSLDVSRNTTIELNKEYLKFSAAHFTIFSATERERLHGHNFLVAAEIDVPVGDDGLCFNYKLFKEKLRKLCDEIDEYVLLPEFSPHLEISDEGENFRATYNGETMWFLKADTILLPIRNTTVEEFSFYLLNRLLEAEEEVAGFGILRIKVRVSSGPGQTGSSEWHRDKVGS